MQLIGSLAKVNRQRAERINQELQEKLCHMFQSETAIDYACAQDRVLREHFLQMARSHREEVLPPELEEIFEPRQLDLDEPEDDETETGRAVSEREKRELFRQHRNLGHLQPTELARALRHAGARREAIRFVLKELRCPTCEARPLPLPPRPGMLPRCLRFNQCIGVDLVDLEVRDGTSAKALNVVCWGTGLQIVVPATSQSGASTAHRVSARSETRRSETRSNRVRSQGNALSNVRSPTSTTSTTPRHVATLPAVQAVYWCRFGGPGSPRWDFSQSFSSGLLGHGSSNRPNFVDWVHGPRCDV